MKWGEFFRVSFSALLANKVRSLLTMLGIIIGVGAVITMISLGQGAKKAVSDRLQALGTNLIYIRAGSGPSRGGIRMAIGSSERITEQDLKRLRAECATIDKIVPELPRSSQVAYGNKNWNTSVIGTSPDYLELRNFKIADGHSFSEREVNSMARVAIIGPKVVENLFGDVNPVGQTIRVGRLSFDVIAVTEAKGVSGGWLDFDDVVIVPYTTAQKRVFGVDFFNSLVAQIKDISMLPSAYVEIEKVLRKSHRLRPDQENDFNLQSQSDFAAARQETTQTLTYLLLGVALVSLLVGGIGIMNIMLVSVTERTREIGVRIAVGARRRDILMQFVLEAVTLALLGGILGILLGIGSSYGMTKFFGWSTLIVPGSAVVSFLFAFAIGLFFGIYPARKASLMDPIEALRYE
jgi:putative ABC transport system permease protein